jgi:hypothetical protein
VDTFAHPHSPPAAFDFFDSKSKGRITTQDLKSRLTVFYKSLQPREFKFLMNNQPEMTFEQLYAMLSDNELTNFDPVAEAFKIYDPTDSGHVNMDVLVDIFSHLGFGKLSEDDIKVRSRFFGLVAASVVAIVFHFQCRVSLLLCRRCCVAALSPTGINRYGRCRPRRAHFARGLSKNAGRGQGASSGLQVGRRPV